MRVTCALFGPFRDTAGQKNVDIEVSAPATVSDALEELTSAIPELEDDLESVEQSGSVAITVDKKHINHLDGLATELEEGSTVRITPPIIGGTSRRYHDSRGS